MRNVPLEEIRKKSHSSVAAEVVHEGKSASKPCISFIGLENGTWNDKATDKDKDGSEIGTFRSASVAIESDFLCTTGITFQNSVVAVPRAYGMQAVALRIAGDKSMLYRIRILGSQDTLLDDQGSHYFYQCYIEGTVDFIFGSSRSLYQLKDPGQLQLIIDSHRMMTQDSLS